MGAALSRWAIQRREMAQHALALASISPASNGLEVFAEQLVESWLLEVVERVLEHGERLTLPGFGTFYRATWAPKAGRFRGQSRHRLCFKAASKLRGRA